MRHPDPLHPTALLLLCLLRRRSPRTLPELSEATGRSRSGVYGVLRTLRKRGLVTWQEGRTNTLGLTPKGRLAAGGHYIVDEGKRLSVGRLLGRR